MGAALFPCKRLNAVRYGQIFFHIFGIVNNIFRKFYIWSFRRFHPAR